MQCELTAFADVRGPGRASFGGEAFESLGN